MSERKDQRIMAGVLSKILFAVAMGMALLLGVRKGFALLIPAEWCAGTPVNFSAFSIIIVLTFGIAYPANKFGYPRFLRLGATMLAGLILAVLATQLIVGCTPLGAWAGKGRSVLEMFGMAGILFPLAVLHRTVIEPRWSRAMGENGGPAGDEKGGAA